ncbi:MAG: two-component system sensor histidine kinase NtrB [Kiritimatiellia bacterium]|jgi:two-component system, sporulation sensor kinase E
MSSQGGFLDKLVSRMDRLDPESLQTQFLNLVRERGLLETIFRSIQEGIVVVSADGRLFYANHAAETMFGFEITRMRGRPVARYMPDVDWDRLAQREESEWARLSASEVEVISPQRRILQMYAVPMEEGPEGAGPCVVAILRDVTRQREDEAAFIESERMQAVRLLAASVAHEIGNPLNALGIHLQLLEREVKTLPEDERERIGELIAVARDEVARLDLILSKFLRALRPSAPELAACDMLQVLKDALRAMKAGINERRINVAVLHDGPLPEVMADAQQMKQVFFNIIKNALQAMKDGGRLEIRLSADDRDMTLAFKDTGSGIAEERLHRLFEPFQSGKASGHGLGLAIVHRIVQEHGGRVDVASKPGEGACFRVVLPLANRRIRRIESFGGRSPKTGFSG